MRSILLLFLAILVTPLHALEWRNDAFSCTANLPETGGWEALSSPNTKASTSLLTLMNRGRKAAFGVNVLNDPPMLSLRDPAMVKFIEDGLRALSYQFAGHSIVQVGGVYWLQYPVKAQLGEDLLSGTVRFSRGSNNIIYCVSMLTGNGREPSQDPELPKIAESFRVLPPGPAIAAAKPAAPAAPATAPAAATPQDATPASSTDTASANPEKPDWQRIALLAGGGLLVLIVLAKIIGGGAPKK